MSYLLISYPTISGADYEWIQAIRRQNDPKYFEVVRPHITVVFGTEKFNAQELKEHAQIKLKDFKKFPIVLDHATVVQDDSKTFFHTFLIPSVGFDVITQLHDVLYADALATELRHDIPFIPHVGIGTNEDETTMNKLAHKINLQNVRIPGSVAAIHVVQYDGIKVRDISPVSLN